MADTHRVLIVEDEAEFSGFLSQALSSALGDAVSVRDCPSAERAAALLGDWRPDLLLLDLNLPGGMDGMALLKTAARLPPPDAPHVIVVTGAEAVKLDCAMLDRGADEVLKKPFDADELVSRVRAALRRRPRPAGPRISVSAARREVTANGKACGLTKTEFDILLCLARTPGKVVTLEHLSSCVLGIDNPELREAAEHTIAVHVGHLRNKLGPCGALVVNVRGVGYRLADGAVILD